MDQDYCGCCGGDASKLPKGEHWNCCKELHDIEIATDDAIRMLRDEAGTAGDLAQARICDLALGITAGDMEELMDRSLYAEEAAAIAGMTPGDARAECERVIADAAAQLT